MGNYNFGFIKGEDYEQELIIRDTETHEPIDITDYEFTADCRDNIRTGEVLFSFTFVKDIDPTTGRVVMSVARSITAALIPDAGIYDMFVKYTSRDKREPYLYGNVVFRTAATQEPVV